MVAFVSPIPSIHFSANMMKVRRVKYSTSLRRFYVVAYPFIELKILMMIKLKELSINQNLKVDVKKDDPWKVEKILKTRGNEKCRQYFLKWI